MNITMVLEMAAGGYGARGAVVTDAGEVSYEALHERVRARARALAAAAAEAQVGHVAYLGLSGNSYIEHLLAAATAGLPFVPLNYRTRAEELAALLEPLSPVLLVHDPAYADKALAAAGAHDVPLTPDALGTSADGELPAVDGDAVAVLLYTSGTTSAPKAVVLRHRHLCSYIFGVVEFGSAVPGETTLCTVPPYHIAGIMGVLTPLYAGRRLVFLPQFDATAWLEAAARHDVTHAFVVPTMLSRIVEVLEADPALRPAALRHIAYGGGPIHRALVERALALLPDVDFVNAYGLTETSSTVALLSPDDHRAAVASGDPAVRARLGSVGRPLPGIEVRILDEDGDELPAGEVGIVAIAGPQVSGQYRGADAPGGRFVTGDLGHLDSGGYLFLGGRSDDVIIRGGENISPGEIEDVLARHPDVGHVAVVGVPDEEWGQRVVAFVEPRTEDHASGDDLRDWARAAGLAGFKIPASVAFLDELPRNDTGKVLRRRLREAWVDDVPEPA
jgi:acyl-CoA synthetase (AMP-forming)/AMP-acid ligase II